MNTSEHILSMPLTELRERVELAERMALAARLTPTGTYDAESAPVNTGSTASSAPAAEPAKPTRTRRTKDQIAADEAAAAAAKAAETPAANAGSGPSADDLMAAMTPEPAADEGGSELSLDDIGGGDDMMAGFEASMTPEEARKQATAIIADIQAKKDTARLAVAREALVKVGAQKASEVPDDKIVEFYELLPKS